jgi:hypothetical protein
MESKRLIFAGDVYVLDISLPHEVDVDESAAQFDIVARKLHVTASTLKK